MTSSIFQSMVDKALGNLGAAIGKDHAVYRIGPKSSGDFPAAWLKLTPRVSIHRNRVTSRDLESNLMSERTLWYEVIGDMSQFRLGDVFVSSEADYQPGLAYGAGATSIPGTQEIDGFALAWHAHASAPIGARISHPVQIYRPELSPAMQTDGSKRWAETHETDMPLILSNGVYSWGAPGGTASIVPAGLGSNDREYRGGAFQPDDTGILPMGRFYVYLPILPGYDPAEGDAVITEDDTRFVMTSPYTQRTGVVGHQATIERQISGT